VEDIVDELVAKDSSIVRKPILLGTPLLTVPFNQGGNSHGIPSWNLLRDPADRVLIVTSNYPRLKREQVQEVLSRWVERFHLSNEVATSWATQNAEKVFSLGWNNMPGYGTAVVQGAMFHNAYRTIHAFAPQMNEAFQNASKLGLNIVGVLMESTEMAMHSNSIRRLKSVPVWDVSSLGKCLVKSASTFNSASSRVSEQVFTNAVFMECMLSWHGKGATRLEALFGQQANGKILHYDDQGLSSEALDKIHCSGGRPEGMRIPVGRRMRDFDTGSDDPAVVSEACSLTEFSCLCDDCNGVCPGAGNCGSETSPCGVQGEGKPSAACMAANQIDVRTFDRKAQCPKPGPESNLVASDSVIYQ
jgi:hypothetical protein